MAMTVTKVRQEQLGFLNVSIVTLAADASYPTGGYAVTPAQLGVGINVDFFISHPKNGYLYEWDGTNQKVLVRQSAGSAAALAEPSAATNLSTLTAKVLVLGH